MPTYKATVHEHRIVKVDCFVDADSEASARQRIHKDNVDNKGIHSLIKISKRVIVSKVEVFSPPYRIFVLRMRNTYGKEVKITTPANDLHDAMDIATSMVNKGWSFVHIEGEE